jgi:hypothetical protein
MRGIVLAAAVVLLVAGCGSDRPGSGGRGGGGSSGTDSGIRVHTSVSPGCPLEHAGAPCSAQPIAAAVEVRDAAGSVVADIGSSSHGTFRFGLAPGEYDVTVSVDKGVPTPQRQHAQVTVMEGRYTPLDMVFDSGIRGGPAPVT